MKRSVALAALALWALAQCAHAQEPVPFDYRCNAAAAATTPAALPADGWQRAEDGRLPRAAGSPCWLRIDVARNAPRVLRASGSYGSRDVAVFSLDGELLAAAGEHGPRDRVIFGSGGDDYVSMLFPSLRAEDGRILLRLQRSRSVRFEATDLAEAVQGERNLDFVHLGLGLLYAVVALLAALLGAVNRDRGQFVLAALFA